MSAMPKTDERITEAEYFDLLREAEGSGVSYELIDGYVYAMSGGSADHAAIEMNLVSMFARALEDTRCSPRTSNMAVVAKNSYFFPDVSVHCDEPQYVPDAPIAILANPVVVVEVLSKSTETKDRTLKLDSYTANPTLQDYIIVWQDHPRIDHYARGANSAWILTRTEDISARVELPSIGVTLSLERVYRDVSFQSNDEP